MSYLPKETQGPIGFPSGLNSPVFTHFIHRDWLLDCQNYFQDISLEINDQGNQK